MECPTVRENGVLQGDSSDLLKCLDEGSVDLVITSPPYANARKEHYGGVPADDWKEWFMPISKEIHRVLKPTGSFVLNVKENSVNKVRHPYVQETVLGMMKDGWQLRDEFMWVKANQFPIKPIYRLKDGFERLYHFTKSDDFTWNPDAVMVDAKPDTCARYKRAMEQKTFSHSSPNMKRYERNFDNFKKLDCKKAYPNNVIVAPVGRGRTKHPARFPAEIPGFFIDLLTNKGDVVLDPFMGSGTTGIEAKKRCRKAIGFDIMPEYVEMANTEMDLISCEVK